MTHWRDYLALTKPRISLLVVLTTWLGFSLAASEPSFGRLWWWLIFGTALTACGASALNQYLERDLDAKMRRTQSRPIPKGRLTVRQALIFGVTISFLGFGVLGWKVNALTSLLSFLSWASYLFIYTPMKTRTSLCTLAGAVPGAIPPMMGWAAARNSLSMEAWILFAIMFVWQLPHFLAIAWMFKDDYAQAGFPMLPVVDPDGGSTSRMIILYCAILIPISLLPARIGITGYSYFYGAMGLGIAFLAVGVLTAFHRSIANARRLLLASVIYLPALLIWMVVAA